MPLSVRAALTPPEMHEWRKGRRAGFRNRCPRGYVSSNLTLCTNEKSRIALVDMRFFHAAS